MEVLNELKPGLDEKLYERAMNVNITGLGLALLMNFKNARLDRKRVVRQQQLDERDDPNLYL